jgi:hypothetical protein
VATGPPTTTWHKSTDVTAASLAPGNAASRYLTVPRCRRPRDVSQNPLDSRPRETRNPERFRVQRQADACLVKYVFVETPSKQLTRFTRSSRNERGRPGQRRLHSPRKPNPCIRLRGRRSEEPPRPGTGLTIALWADGSRKKLSATGRSCRGGRADDAGAPPASGPLDRVSAPQSAGTGGAGCARFPRPRQSAQSTEDAHLTSDTRRYRYRRSNGAWKRRQWTLDSSPAA